MYSVILSPKFREELAKLDNPLQKRVRNILKRLETQLVGEALKGDLRGFYSVHFEHNKYRLIYYKEDDKIEVLVVKVGRRTDDFYNKIRSLLKI